MPWKYGQNMETHLKLHLGYGSTVVQGWENIDRSPNVVLSRAYGQERCWDGAES
jgi:hypothetical protein